MPVLCPLPFHLQVSAVENLSPSRQSHVLSFSQRRVKGLAKEFRQPVLLRLHTGQNFGSPAPSVVWSRPASFPEACPAVAVSSEMGKIDIGDESVQSRMGAQLQCALNPPSRLQAEAVQFHFSLLKPYLPTKAGTIGSDIFPPKRRGA